ncbi:MAG: hypothetical protein ACKO6N_19235 [Myxococcota bacterium]
MKKFWLSLLLMSAVVPSFAQAQDADDVTVTEEDGKRVRYRATTEISFEGVDVEGEIKKPAGSYLLDRKRSKFSPLIKFRPDFEKEMLQSVDEVK